MQLPFRSRCVLGCRATLTLVPSRRTRRWPSCCTRSSLSTTSRYLHPPNSYPHRHHTHIGTYTHTYTLCYFQCSYPLLSRVFPNFAPCDVRIVYVAVPLSLIDENYVHVFGVTPVFFCIRLAGVCDYAIKCHTSSTPRRWKGCQRCQGSTRPASLPPRHPK